MSSSPPCGGPAVSVVARRRLVAEGFAHEAGGQQLDHQRDRRSLVAAEGEDRAVEDRLRIRRRRTLSVDPDILWQRVGRRARRS